MDFTNTKNAAVATFSHFWAVEAAKDLEPEDKIKAGCLEAVHILGYVPIVGVIVGIARIIYAATQIDSNLKAVKGFFRLRAAAEIVGLGPILLVVDLIGTKILLHKLKKEQQII